MGTTETTMNEEEIRDRDVKYLLSLKEVEKKSKLHSISINGCLIQCKQKDRLEQYKELLSNTRIKK